jgi:CYTH domain-containing protein
LIIVYHHTNGNLVGFPEGHDIPHIPGTMSDVDVNRPETEIERKYLVEDAPDSVFSEPPARIAQGYIAVGSDGTEVRLRNKQGRYTQTVKAGSGLSRLETEVVLSGDQFEALWIHTGGRRLEKDRYEVPYRDVTIELDVFRGTLEGLVIAEVEFGTIEDSERFEPPAWFGEEVTEDIDYRNRNLATNGMPGRRA